MPTKFVSKNIRVPVLNLTSLGHVKVLTMLDLENIRHANAIFSVKVSMKTSGILHFQTGQLLMAKMARLGYALIIERIYILTKALNSEIHEFSCRNTIFLSILAKDSHLLKNFSIARNTYLQIHMMRQTVTELITTYDLCNNSMKKLWISVF